MQILLFSRLSSKKMNIKICTIVIVSDGLDVCEIWSLVTGRTLIDSIAEMCRGRNLALREKN
jgi:hypothetical protein